MFSIRNSSVQAYLEPVVHEIKVSRADLLGDLQRADKRQAYLSLGGQCWYVLGCNARGEPIADADELRAAPRRSMPELPFALWLALAKAAPLPGYAALAIESGEQGQLDAPQSLD